MTPLRITSADRIMDAVQGAVISSIRVDDGEGMCIDLQDGRTLVIAGAVALSLIRFESERLH